MADEITLQSLIDKVRADLLSPLSGVGNIDKKTPLFFVDQVELEIVVDITKDDKGGIKLSVPQILEGSFEGGQARSSTHHMKITLSPILTRDELRAAIDKDEKLKQQVMDISVQALRKGISELRGEEE